MKRLPISFELGKARYIHAGYAAHKIIGRIGKVMEMAGPIRQSAEQAVRDAERYGEGHAAFRLVKSKSRTITNGRVNREDLPVALE